MKRICLFLLFGVALTASAQESTASLDSTMSRLIQFAMHRGGSNLSTAWQRYIQSCEQDSSIVIVYRRWRWHQYTADKPRVDTLATQYGMIFNLPDERDAFDRQFTVIWVHNHYPNLREFVDYAERYFGRRTWDAP